MNERVQRILDGEIPRTAAAEAELAEAAQTEAAISAVLRAVPVEQVPDLAPEVMRRIAALSPAQIAQASSRPKRLHAWWQWIWMPRPLTLSWRPAYAFALLLLLPLLVRNAPTGVPATVPQQVLVQFRLDAPDASDVALAGNFSDWQPKHHLTRTAGGVWTITIPLEQGVYRYAFVVNGRTWQPDPLAPAVSDGFGGQNSQIAVLRPDMSVES